jgi:hypothetical protein
MAEMAAKSDPLADKLVQLLEEQRPAGSYPPTLQQLIGSIDPPPAADDLAKTIRHKHFKDRALVAFRDTSNLASLVALKADVKQLATSPLVLNEALEMLCTPENRTVSLSAVKKLLDPAVARHLEAAVKEQIAHGTLPASVGARKVKATFQLYLTRLPAPPPPPPPPSKQELLARQLVDRLEAQRQLGPDTYPLTLTRLAELCGPGISKPMLTKACKLPAFAERVVVAGKKPPAALALLREDIHETLSSHRLWDGLVKAARLATKRITDLFALSKLQKELSPELQSPFAAAAEHGPPTGVGWMWLNGEKCYFMVRDIQGGPRAAPNEPAVPPAPVESSAPVGDFAQEFDEAFERIDRRMGGHNFVSLVELRRAIPCDRAAFDTELRKLRIASRYTLSAVEGRDGITPEQQQAGILEEGSLLLNVHRKSP